MKRVICLYRVSTVGQVDHDDIPMQRKACHEYVKQHPDWVILDEISEKGISGYKVSTNSRDAIVEIKRRAVAGLFDVLLVFMFDRLGRRDDETPFVVQWFVQQGIEVWSTKEGEQRFDNHVDKLLNYIRFWQASGESEKTSMRVRTKHSQMIQDGQYRGGLIPYGYRLEYLGRMNKKDKPVPDLVIDEEEAAVVQKIVSLILDEGYGMHRVANWLNEHGIKTKRGTTLWRNTSIRAMLSNPIYMGVMRFGDELSPVFENLIIIPAVTFHQCQDMIKARAPQKSEERDVPMRTDARGLLAGLLYCKECGARLTFNHNTTRKVLSGGIIRIYERDMYRCYRKLNSKKTCRGQSTYNCDILNSAVKQDVRRFFQSIRKLPRSEMFDKALSRNHEIAKKAYNNALAAYTKAQQAVVNLENQTAAALSGEVSLNIEIINAMMPKLKAAEAKAKAELDVAQERYDAEEEQRMKTEQEMQKLFTWADCFERETIEAQHMILAALIDRIEVGYGYKLTIYYKLTAAQYLNLGDDDQEAAI